MTEVNNFQEIVLHNYPIIDVRAPIEFEKGAIPNSVNLYLMNNEERALVGTTYKEKGHNAAIELGHSLVSGKIKEERINSWIEFYKKNTNTHILCFRGGDRSHISQQWIYENSGIDIPLIIGGYKAFRNYLLDQFEKPYNIRILSGATGSGKTILLNKINNTVDLEGIANHRGSSFGGNREEQPCQVDFENSLAYKLIDFSNNNFSYLYLEDESRNIGKRRIPNSLFEKMAQAKMVHLIVSLEERTNTIYNEYVIHDQESFKSEWIDKIKSSLAGISRKLGGKRHNELLEIVDSAWKEQVNSGNLEQHKEWIKVLLTDYYDPMYNYQIEKRKEQIIFRGNKEEVLNYIKE